MSIESVFEKIMRKKAARDVVIANTQAVLERGTFLVKQGHGNNSLGLPPDHGENLDVVIRLTLAQVKRREAQIAGLKKLG